ncbi:MAG: antirestriction protein ArdA [Bacteroides sp.]|nr:antirestriction protein ArdA [Bacteroides sp.]
MPRTRERRLSRSAWLSQEHHCGEWDSEEDFARHIVEECCNLGKMMGSLANYFDYEAFARELFNREQTVTFSAEYDPSNRLINFFLILSVEIL